jgi:hypothetical protein
MGIKGIKCGSPWCPDCGRTVTIKNIKKIEKVLLETSSTWASITLTIDRDRFPGPGGPIDAYEDVRKNRRVSQFIRRGRRQGRFTRSYFGFVEFQGGRWIHIHLCVELTEAFGARLGRAARSKGGRAIIKINNDEIGPLWGLGFTHTRFGVDPAMIACYAAAHGAAGGKEMQRGLPIWYDEWREETGGKRMQKWTFSLGFWDALKKLEGIEGVEKSNHPQSDRRDRRHRMCYSEPGEVVQRPTSVIIKACGDTDSLVYAEVQAVFVDLAGEIKEEGYYHHALGRVRGGVVETVDLLRRGGIEVNEDKEGEYLLSLEALRSIRGLLPEAKWFGWDCLPDLGVYYDGYDDVEILSETFGGEVNSEQAHKTGVRP